MQQQHSGRASYAARDHVLPALPLLLLLLGHCLLLLLLLLVYIVFLLLLPAGHAVAAARVTYSLAVWVCLPDQQTTELPGGVTQWETGAAGAGPRARRILVRGTQRLLLFCIAAEAVHSMQVVKCIFRVNQQVP